MPWLTPTFRELKMDAEIGSYQEDDRNRDTPLIVRAKGADAHEYALLSNCEAGSPSSP